MNKIMIFLALAGLVLLGSEDQVLAQSSDSDLTAMSMEDLMNVEVYSASKKPERFFDTAAAIYVITSEDIRRSGATSIPELLRMVPGLTVQKFNSHTWDISARGFNGSVFANKLLVLMDGRAVYTPLYGGVYWDVQDTVLEDIDRIEVIRGPGGTLWGANAVNGVINIITKKASETQGTLVSFGGGSDEEFFSTLRYGGQSKDLFYRSYVKYLDRSEGYLSNGKANDQWEMGRTGFRAEKDKLTVQGDFYQGEVGQRTTLYSFGTPHTVVVDRASDVQGANITAHYDDTDWSLLGYWDMTNRDLQILSEERNTFDLEYTRRVQPTANQDVTWGLTYRLEMEDMGDTTTAQIRSTSQADELFSLFVQDEIKFLDDRLKLILGSKVEHNIFTHFEVQPNVRLSYDIDDHSMVWAAASRAVRTPSRVEEDGEVVIGFSGGTFEKAIGNDDLSAETLRAFEVGYRNQVMDNVLLDLSLYANHYDDLITYTLGNTVSENGFNVITLPTVNGMAGDVQGAELATDIKIKEWWKIKDAFTFTNIHLSTDEGVNSLGVESALEQAVPPYSTYLRSSFDLPHDFQLDATIRYSSAFDNNHIHPMTQMDINLTKKIGSWEISLVGQNLFQNHHKESLLSGATQVERSGYAKVTRRF